VITRAKPGGRDLWVLDADRGVASRFMATPGNKGYSVWSPDGRTIVFGSGAPLNVFRKLAAGGGGEERLMESSNFQYPGDWSRGGRFLLYNEIAGGTGMDLWILPVTPDGKLAPDAKPRPYLRTQFNERYGRFSPEPNPRWVAYEWDESGRMEIYGGCLPGTAEPSPDFNWRRRIPGIGSRWPQAVLYDSRFQAHEGQPEAGSDSIDPSPPQELFALPIAYDSYIPYEIAPGGWRFLCAPRRRNKPAVRSP
jgi:hypothetical protein